VGFFQFLRNFRQLNAFEQAEKLLHAALDTAIASRAKMGEFVTCLDHFDLLQTAINRAKAPILCNRWMKTFVFLPSFTHCRTDQRFLYVCYGNPLEAV
jgi:hypothetical protein